MLKATKAEQPNLEKSDLIDQNFAKGPAKGMQTFRNPRQKLKNIKDKIPNNLMKFQV